MKDMNEKPTELNLSFTYDDSPNIIGMGVKRFSMTDNFKLSLKDSMVPLIIMKMTLEKDMRKVEIYLSISDPLRGSIRLLIIPTVITNFLIGEARRTMERGR